MIPGGVLSTVAVPARFTGARSLPVTKTIDYEDGGIGIQNTSAGLLYQRWRARLFDPGETYSKVMLSAPNTVEFVLIELPGLTEISISFDQNMRPILAFVQDGVSKLRWYDPIAGAQVIVDISEGAITPRVSYDDKRFLATAGYQTSDVILSYVRDGNLYYRQQRDRFQDEYLLATGVKPLIKTGMCRNLRFQWMSEA